MSLQLDTFFFHHPIYSPWYYVGGSDVATFVLFSDRKRENKAPQTLHHRQHYARAGRRRDHRRRRTLRQVRLHDARIPDHGGPREQGAQEDKAVQLQRVRPRIRVQDDALTSHEKCPRRRNTEGEEGRRWTSFPWYVCYHLSHCFLKQSITHRLLIK